MSQTDDGWMARAIAQARLALAAGEVPIGACLVRGEQWIDGHNRVVAAMDPTAHAELFTLREASQSWRCTRLDGARLFVTVEPCAMCTAACVYAGVEEVVYAASLADFSQLTGRSELPGTPGTLQLRTGANRAESLELIKAWSARQAIA